MQSFNRLSITAKLLLGPLGGSLVILAIVAQFVVSYRDIARISAEAERAALLMTQADQALLGFARGHIALFKAVSWTAAHMESAVVDGAVKAVHGEVADAVRRLAVFDGDRSLAEPADLEAARQSLAAYVQAADGIIAYLEIDVFAATMAMNDLNETASRAEAALRGLAHSVATAQQELKDETARTLDRAFSRMMTGAVVAVLILFVGSILFARLLSHPIRALTGAMGRIASGALDTEVPATERGDEIGDMGRALLVFKRNAEDAGRMVQEREAARDAREKRMVAFSGAMQDLEQRVSRIVERLNDAAIALRDTSDSVVGTVRDVRAHSTEAVDAAGAAADDVQAVATAAAALSSAVGDVGQAVSRSARTTNLAVEETARATTTMRGLASAAQQIGAVVDLINRIASQTNLLALNATIEAARAGDAGKGFAVVANEVKQLANQTARATDDIRNQISGVQAAAENAQIAIDHIGTTIADVNAITAGIAATIEQQGAAIRSMAVGTGDASHRTDVVLDTVRRVSDATEAAAAAMQTVLSSASALSRDAELLHTTFNDFRQQASVA